MGLGIGLATCYAPNFFLMWELNVALIRERIVI